jgi:hypothetical protein
METKKIMRTVVNYQQSTHKKHYASTGEKKSNLGFNEVA